MHASILIPTRNRPGHLLKCLACLRGQGPSAGSFEVVVVHDGPDPSGSEAVAGFDPMGRFDLRRVEAPRLGNAHAKNVALEAARGAVSVFLNDDVTPAPGFIAAHLRAHAEATTPRLCVGYAPWTLAPRPTLFERMLRETSMVFFYDRMADPDGASLMPPSHDWGYRHAWTLNLSAPTDEARAVGFTPGLANCCYEDVEFGWRFTRTHGAPVLFRPEARADHDHPMSPSDYLKREFRLGYSAWGFARENPACAADVFRRDITTSEAVAEARATLEADEPHARSWRAWFESLHGQPAPPGVDLSELYRRHLPLKRHEFRRGLLAAAEGEVIEGLFPATVRPAAATIPTDAHFSGTAAVVGVAGPRAGLDADISAPPRCERHT